MTILGACIAVMCAVVLLVGCCALAVMDYKKHPNKAFDERQTAARGKAYEISLYFGVLYYGVVAVVLTVFPEETRTVSAGNLVLIGLFFILLAVHSCCLFSDAVLPLRQNPIVLAVCYLVGGIMWLFPMFQELWLFGPEVSSGMWLHLSGAATLLSIGVIHWIAYLRDRK